MADGARGGVFPMRGSSRARHKLQISDGMLQSDIHRLESFLADETLNAEQGGAGGGEDGATGELIFYCGFLLFLSLSLSLAPSRSLVALALVL